MSEELRVFINKYSDIIELYQYEDSMGFMKLILDEKIQSLLDIDEAMSDAMVEWGNSSITKELAKSTWEVTTWHKIIKKQIDNLRNLRKELE